MPCRETGPKRVLQTGRPSADVRVIIIIPLPQMARSRLLPPRLPGPLSVVPRDVKGPDWSLAASGAPSLGSAWASLQIAGSFFRCKDPSSCQRAAPGGAPRAGVAGGWLSAARKQRPLGAGRAPSGFNAQWPGGLAASLLACICIMSGAGTGARSIGNCEAVLSKEKGPVLKARLAYCNANSIQSRQPSSGSRELKLHESH